MNRTTHIILNRRDAALVIMVYLYGGLTTDHIRKRFWPDSRSHTPCSEAVSKLVKASLLQSRRLPALNGIGSGRAFLTVGPKARPLIAQALGVSRSELGRNSRIESSQFIAHHLALVDFRLSLELEVEHCRVFTLADWSGDREVSLKVKDPKTEQDLVLIPDATFALALPDGTEQPFYLEIDMATLSPKRLRAKIRGYIASGGSTPIMFVTVDVNREAAIARYALEEAQAVGADPTIFWLSTKDRVTEATVLDAPIWQVVGGPTIALNSLVPSDYQPHPGFSPVGQITFNGGYVYDS